MSQKYEKLKALLKELFQLDQPDLDFGLFRIMHAKSGEVRAREKRIITHPKLMTLLTRDSNVFESYR